MRLFQNSGNYPSYVPRLNRLAACATRFAERRSVFLDDRYGACHLLKPILTGDSSAFFTNGDDEILQRMWALEHGLPDGNSLDAILLSQIEEHRTEVFYNMDPMRYQSGFVRRLPGCVKSAIAWRAAPSPRADFSAYAAVVCNFPGILRGYRQMGWRTAYLSPAHDPVMDDYALANDRPTDVLFVGGYSRHHRRRAAMLEAVARLAGRYTVRMHLDRSRLNRLAESVLGIGLPLWRHRRPRLIRRVAREPVFGRDLYGALSSAKIVLNGAVDMAGTERGNMRCFEAMGCRSALVSDTGEYPPDMQCQTTMKLYESPGQAVEVIENLLSNAGERQQMAARGYDVIRTRYSKDRQWNEFCSLVGELS